MLAWSGMGVQREFFSPPSCAFIASLCRAQILPEISADPSVTVINFCRTPQWFVPRVSEFLPTSRF